MEKQITEKIKETTGILIRDDFFSSLDAVKASIIAAACMAVVLMLWVQCCPGCCNYLVVPAAAVALGFAIGLTIAFDTKEVAVRDAIAGVLIVVLALLIVSVYKNSLSIKIHGVFLRQASKIIGEKWLLLLFVVLYLVMLVLFIALVMFEFVGFWSNGRKIFLPLEYVYYKLEGFKFSGLVAVILAVQTIWGVAFLKQSCIFVYI